MTEQTCTEIPAVKVVRLSDGHMAYRWDCDCGAFCVDLHSHPFACATASVHHSMARAQRAALTGCPACEHPKHGEVLCGRPSQLWTDVMGVTTACGCRGPESARFSWRAVVKRAGES